MRHTPRKPLNIHLRRRRRHEVPHHDPATARLQRLGGVVHVRQGGEAAVAREREPGAALRAREVAAGEHVGGGRGPPGGGLGGAGEDFVAVGEEEEGVVWVRGGEEEDAHCGVCGLLEGGGRGVRFVKQLTWWGSVQAPPPRPVESPAKSTTRADLASVYVPHVISLTCHGVLTDYNKSSASPPKIPPHPQQPPSPIPSAQQSQSQSQSQSHRHNVQLHRRHPHVPPPPPFSPSPPPPNLTPPSSLLTTLLPLYLASKALHTNSLPHLTHWLTYFLLLSLLHLTETHLGFLISWLPLYAWARLAVHLHLLLAAPALYTAHLAPWLAAHERRIDRALAALAARAQQLAGPAAPALRELLAFLRRQGLLPRASASGARGAGGWGAWAWAGASEARAPSAVPSTSSLLALLGNPLQAAPTTNNDIEAQRARLRAQLAALVEVEASSDSDFTSSSSSSDDDGARPRRRKAARRTRRSDEGVRRRRRGAGEEEGEAEAVDWKAAAAAVAAEVLGGAGRGAGAGGRGGAGAAGGAGWSRW